MRYGTRENDIEAIVVLDGTGALPESVRAASLAFRGKVLLGVALRGIMLGMRSQPIDPGLFPLKLDCFNLSKSHGLVVRVRSRTGETMAQVAAMRKDGICAHDMVRRASVHCYSNHEKYWRKTSGPISSDSAGFVDVLPIWILTETLGQSNASGLITFGAEGANDGINGDAVFECLVFETNPRKLARRFAGHPDLVGGIITRFRALGRPTQWSWAFSNV